MVTNGNEINYDRKKIKNVNWENNKDIRIFA